MLHGHTQADMQTLIALHNPCQMAHIGLILAETEAGITMNT